MKNKVAITTTSFAEYSKEPLSLLKKNDLEVSLNPYGRKLKRNEILEVCKDAAGIIAGTERIDADVMKKLPNLMVISRCGSGLDNIDLTCAEKLGIKIVNTPEGPTRAVAELTVGLLLNLLRKVNRMDTAVRNGKWNKLMGSLLMGKKVGILGFGRIGQKVAELLSAFSVRLAYCDIETKLCLINCSRKRFKDILAWADVLTLHLSGSKDGKPIIGKKELSLMKKGSWLINLSRGGVVDEKALYQALKNRHLLGAAVDVFEEEPYTGPLRELDNVILTPHIGSYAKEARVQMETQAVENLLTALKDASLRNRRGRY